MATYKKKGTKKVKNEQVNSIEDHSTTAEVFNTLDETASRSEQWVEKNQKPLFYSLIVVAALILGYLGYNKYVAGPKEQVAANELAFPKVYFDQAINSSVAVDSLLTLGLEGADGKYGFIDIADKFSGTKAGNLAHYYAGISYLKIKSYKEAIEHLNKFSSDDELFGPAANATLGDAFADIDQQEDALTYYEKAANAKDNSAMTPLYLFKAGNTALDLKKFSKAASLFTHIKEKYPTSDMAIDIDMYINKAKYAQN
jgi:TolA-binding protein